MPTPTRSFLDVAAKYGNVDPNDGEAIQHWFTTVLPSLPRETIEEIIEDLLEHEGVRDDQAVVASYPRDVPLPSSDSSPPAPIPLLASNWRELILKLTGRLKHD